MSTKPRYSKEEHARLGDEIYSQQIQSQVEKDHAGRIVAIDVDSAQYEVADDTVTACQQLLARYPDAQPWVVRVGHDAVHRFGTRSKVVG